MLKVCCSDMEIHLYIVNKDTRYNSAFLDDKCVEYSPKYNEYAIPSGCDTSYYVINYCPWCGKKLPLSLRNKWFNELVDLGYESPFEDDIPKEYLSDAWWNK